jgi:hypothetical protein
VKHQLKLKIKPPKWLSLHLHLLPHQPLANLWWPYAAMTVRVKSAPSQRRWVVVPDLGGLKETTAVARINAVDRVSVGVNEMDVRDAMEEEEPKAVALAPLTHRVWAMPLSVPNVTRWNKPN